MMKFNGKEVEVVEEVIEVSVEDIQMAKAVLAAARKDKLNKVLDKSKAIGKKALMYGGPVLGVGGLAYLYKKSQEANNATTAIDGEFTVIEIDDKEIEVLVRSEETGE